jgi:hypothetical protein
MIQVGEDVQPRAKVGVFGIGLEAYWDQEKLRKVARLLGLEFAEVGRR